MSEKSNKVIRIDAKPEPINIEPSKTAVIVVDMQNDFGSKGGMFDRAGLGLLLRVSGNVVWQELAALLSPDGSSVPSEALKVR
jgi:hypothetical protein